MVASAIGTWWRVGLPITDFSATQGFGRPRAYALGLCGFSFGGELPEPN
jgi:hypothetical protein